MTTPEIIAQVVGFVTCGVACSSYFPKNKFFYLLFQLLVNVLFGVQYTLLTAWSGVINNAISCLKIIYIMLKERKGKNINNVELVVFMLVCVIAGAFVIDGWIDIIPIVNSVLFTFAVCQNNKIVLRIIVMVTCALWVVYGIFVGSYVSAVYSFVEMIVAGATIFKVKMEQKNEEKLNNQCQDTCSNE